MMKKYVMDAGNLPNVVGEKIAELNLKVDWKIGNNLTKYLYKL